MQEDLRKQRENLQRRAEGEGETEKSDGKMQGKREKKRREARQESSWDNTDEQCRVCCEEWEDKNKSMAIKPNFE